MNKREIFKSAWIGLITMLLMLPFGVANAQIKAVKNNTNGKWGLMDTKKNRTIVKAIYDEVDPANCFTGSKDFAVVRQGKFWGVVDKDGNEMCPNIIISKKLAARAANAQWRKAKVEDNLFDAVDKATGKFGYCNYYGDFVIKPVFDSIDVTKTISEKSEYAAVKYNGCWGALDRHGMFVIKPVFVKKAQLFSAMTEMSEYAQLGQTAYEAVDSQTKKKGFVNYLGNWIVKPVLDDYDDKCIFNSSRNFAVVKRAGKWGCVDRGEVWIVKPVYATAEQAKKLGYQWQAQNPKSGTKASQAHNIDDGKHKLSMLVSSNSAPVKPVTPTTPVNPVTPSTPNGPAVLAQIPTIRIISPKDGTEYSTAEQTFVYEAKTSDGSKASIVAYINGELQPTTKGVRQLSDQITLTLPRKGDVTRVQLIAKDSKGLSSDPAVVRLFYRGDATKPNIHVLSIGVSDYDQADLKLQHAAKDAADFLSAVQNSNLSYYTSLKTASLVTDKMANDRTIKKQLANLVNNVEQNDVVFIYLSGHGAKEGDDTYFLSSNAESDDLFSTAVSFDVIRSATKRMKDKRCKIFIFMDACHSGAMYGQKGISDPITMADPGIIGFYSSTEAQKSNESEEWKNGIFTKALIEGLNGKAADEGGNITIDGLEKYIRQEVRNATGGKQMPIFENKQGNYILFPKRY
ncbi:MAG: caspase family protein [Paludibacteraceae bacterium]|nr:caspase family protein [Paludibacteraceae bacterium]